MKYSFKSLVGLFLVATTLTVSSCGDDDANSFNYDSFEQELLDEWIKINAPEFVGYRQSDGYYLKITEESTTSSQSIKDIVATNDDCWISYYITGYDLENNVVITRRDMTAWQQGTYYRQTHYTPIFLSVSTDSYLPPFMYDAITKALVTENDGVTTSLKVGDKFTAYVPSPQIGYAATGSMGYYGSSSLASGHPLKAEIEIVALTTDAEATEETQIEDFAKGNGTLKKSTDDADETYTDDEIEISNVTKEKVQGEWSNALDNISNLYINRTYKPADVLIFSPEYTSELPASYTPYYLTNGVNDLESRINTALQEFMATKDFSGDSELTGDRIGNDQRASIWYICRTLDGFIVDTNIDEVSAIITGKPVVAPNVALHYLANEDQDDMIKAWYYSIPQLRFGQWAAILTDSEYAYPDGVAASSTDIGATTEIAKYTPLLFQIYIEQFEY